MHASVVSDRGCLRFYAFESNITFYFRNIPALHLALNKRVGTVCAILPALAAVALSRASWVLRIALSQEKGI